MKKSFLKNEKKYIKAAFISGIALRIIFFIANLIIGGHNCDEVMTSLNAFSLADRLTDINGERLPVYFDTWAIGGQSPFATYISALSVKILGNNLFAVRLPALIFSILGFIALYFFAKEVFNDDKYRFALVGLGAVSPWMIFSAGYVLDCNYLGHILMFAMLFFVKAVKTNKTSFYITSCFFFSLCFYCYIASILFIPFILIALYLTLIIKKKISFKNLTLSVIAVTIIALPFIVWGLVITGIIQPFNFLGFSFSEMPNYARGGDTVIASGGLSDKVTALIMNFASSLVLLILNDISATALGSNIFLYGFLLSGIIAIFGLVRLAFEIMKKRRGLTFTAKVTAVGCLIGCAAFCALVNEPHLGSLYRYGILSYLLIFIEAIGIIEVVHIFKRKNAEKFISIYLVLSLLMFTGVTAFVYVPQTKTATALSLIQENYGDSFFDCLDFAEEKGYGKTVILKSKTSIMNPAAYARYYYYGDKEFFSIEEEIMGNNDHVDKNGDYLVSTDGTVTYRRIEKTGVLNEEFYIIETNRLKEAEYSDEYKTADFGYWTVIYKNR